MIDFLELAWVQRQLSQSGVVAACRHRATEHVERHRDHHRFGRGGLPLLGRHDYLRYTLMGVRSLLRDFDVVEQGVGCGPGMALGMAYASFLQSFFRSRTLQRMAYTFGRFTGFWFKYFDHYLRRTPGGMDAAAGSYFLGRRSERPLSNREVSHRYVGSQAPDPFAPNAPAEQDNRVESR